jgi:hypothetical protein
MPELVEFVSLSKQLELRSDHFPGQRSQPRGINKDPTVWLDGARAPLKHIFKNNMSSTNSKIRPTFVGSIVHFPLARIMA